ncbi:MAG TPA: SDR family NAD(P)-dependent oxidoreductase [Vicinamibacterales bacterium]|nr:SDR family NAD(P)-dependent oxidoreductase [Vicinamibacterales bacterium]
MSLVAMLTLHGRVAVVSGGAGAIGAAICLRLLECGAIVYSLDQAGRTPPEGAIQIACNVTDEAAVAAAVLEVDRRSGRLDILVHAAGITRDARLWKARTEDWNLVIATNLTSAFHLLHASVPAMRRVGAGAIVLISSINGERGKVGQSSYAASKAGVNALARTAARELGGFGIRVNALAPGWITTPMTASLPGDIRQRAVDESALARLGEPDDVARATVFLVSDLARHVTGQVLRVDGGQLIG